MFSVHTHYCLLSVAPFETLQVNGYVQLKKMFMPCRHPFSILFVIFLNVSADVTGLSHTGVEIQPVNTKISLKSLLAKKASMIECSSILACAVTKSRSSGKLTGLLCCSGCLKLDHTTSDCSLMSHESQRTSLVHVYHSTLQSFVRVRVHFFIPPLCKSA